MVHNAAFAAVLASPHTLTATITTPIPTRDESLAQLATLDCLPQHVAAPIVRLGFLPRDIYTAFQCAHTNLAAASSSFAFAPSHETLEQVVLTHLYTQLDRVLAARQEVGSSTDLQPKYPPLSHDFNAPDAVDHTGF